MRDSLKWKLGLRNPEYFNINLLGLKFLNLARNSFGDIFIERFVPIIELDEYIKCISLKQNEISIIGIEKISKIAYSHPMLLSIDIRDNPGY
jgi:hypothetical protein